MEGDLPRRFVLYRPEVGVIGHGVEFQDGWVALRMATATILYSSLAVVLAAWGSAWVIQYDDEERDAA